MVAVQSLKESYRRRWGGSFLSEFKQSFTKKRKSCDKGATKYDGGIQPTHVSSLIAFALSELRHLHIFNILTARLSWSLTLREESRLRVFENRILRRIFGMRMGSGEGSTMMNFIVCTVHII